MTLATMTTFFVDHAVLMPLGAGHLRTLVFIGLIAAVVQASELAMRAYSPRLFEALGLYLPLITTNCAVLGVTLLSARKDATLIETLFFSLGASMGFVLVLALFSSLRERIEIADVPKPFQGAAIGLITAGIAAIAFSGFSGLIRI
jgi:electron transport complex protein RnfA